MSLNIKDFNTNIPPTWCPGCGNFLFLAALKKAFVSLKLKPHQLVVCHDIGCSGNMADFLKTYGLHTLHGRVVPIATGVKMANPKLTVCCFGGDGGLYGEGLSHLISAARHNIPVTVFVADNQLYSLTTGQASPTTPQGAKTKSTPFGTPGIPLDMVKLVKSINQDAFARRVESKNFKKLNSEVLSALRHPGFSLLEIGQNCLAFGKQLKS